MLEQEIEPHLQMIKRDFHDDVTFEGRPYLEKMKWDRIEMLHWLQEERKQQALDYEARVRRLAPLPPAMLQLDPLAQPQS